jgi:hypothetical protein
MSGFAKPSVGIDMHRSRDSQIYLSRPTIKNSLHRFSSQYCDGSPEKLIFASRSLATHPSQYSKSSDGTMALFQGTYLSDNPSRSFKCLLIESIIMQKSSKGRTAGRRYLFVAGKGSPRRDSAKGFGHSTFKHPGQPIDSIIPPGTASFIFDCYAICSRCGKSLRVAKRTRFEDSAFFISVMRNVLPFCKTLTRAPRIDPCVFLFSLSCTVASYRNLLNVVVRTIERQSQHILFASKLHVSLFYERMCV